MAEKKSVNKISQKTAEEIANQYAEAIGQKVWICKFYPDPDRIAIVLKNGQKHTVTEPTFDETMKHAKAVEAEAKAAKVSKK